jgi:multisubunit Na+/H+ antiporter MnhB subunit
MSDPSQTPSYDPDQPQSYGSAPEPQSGYQQSYPPVQQGGAYVQPYGALPEHPQGTAILVLGIVGLFVTICAPIAWYMGSKAQKEIAASGFHYANEQNIKIGKILGMVLTILAIVGIVIAIIAVIIAIIAAAVAGSS